MYVNATSLPPNSLGTERWGSKVQAVETRERRRRTLCTGFTTGVCARARALTARTVRFHHRSTPVDQSVDARASPSGRYASRLDDQRAACPACVRYVSVPNAECQALSKRSLSVCVARLQPPARAARRGRGSSRVAHCETGARGAVDRVKPARWAHSPGVTRRDRTATRRPTEMHRARDASNEAVPEAIQAYHFM